MFGELISNHRLPPFPREMADIPPPV